MLVMFYHVLIKNIVFSCCFFYRNWIHCYMYFSCEKYENFVFYMALLTTKLLRVQSIICKIMVWSVPIWMHDDNSMHVFYGHNYSVQIPCIILINTNLMSFSSLHTFQCMNACTTTNFVYFWKDNMIYM